jgi:hypothetical protein
MTDAAQASPATNVTDVTEKWCLEQVTQGEVDSQRGYKTPVFCLGVLADFMQEPRGRLIGAGSFIGPSMVGYF